MTPLYHFSLPVAVLLTSFVCASAFYLLHGAEPPQCHDRYPGFSPPISAQNPDAVECRGTLKEPLNYQSLSDEETNPFVRRQGRPLYMEKDYAQYKSAIHRFPNVRSCLVDDERGVDVPDLSRFDWEGIESLYEAEFCVFRVFSSIGTVQGARMWLESQGFVGIQISEEDDNAADNGDGHHTNTDVDISGAWSIRKCGARFAGPDKCGIEHTAWSLGVEATLSRGGDVLSVSMGYTIL
jgi:hypothetical protein